MFIYFTFEYNVRNIVVFVINLEKKNIIICFYCKNTFMKRMYLSFRNFTLKYTTVH